MAGRIAWLGCTLLFGLAAPRSMAWAESADRPTAGAPFEPAAGEPTAADASGEGPRTLQIVGYASLATGGAALLTSIALGVKVLELKARFDATPTVETAEDGERAKLGSNVALGLGLGLAATGALLVLIGAEAPETAEHAAEVALVPSVAAGSLGLGAMGRW